MESYPSSDFVRELPIPCLRPRSSFLRLRHRFPRPLFCHSYSLMEPYPSSS
ncbi:Hypothetical protein FKW44_006091 [Caligus rogercresseyi]|uniref:Uncharacterized protein n=1 Tax=Caligus rogercresseyi TaxID=217165 RepID=A0A7T8QSJ2_CALRO|nr:Hypothetical protein FKW44_006091 [Caligus rogercresseyi]